jgi:hypothetical protein
VCLLGDVHSISATCGHLVIGDRAVRAAAIHLTLTDCCLTVSTLESLKATYFFHSWTRCDVSPSQITWDAAGARYFGFPAAWINRGEDTFEEMGQKLDSKLAGLDDPLTVLDDHS